MGINGIGAVRYLANIKSAAEKYHGGGKEDRGTAAESVKCSF